MSADDFQTKYSSVMECMLKSAVAETTKLFETMVDELKAEISKLKKENDDLKTRNHQFEKAKAQVPVNARQCEPLKGSRGGFDKREMATQCGELHIWWLQDYALCNRCYFLLMLCRGFSHTWCDTRCVLNVYHLCLLIRQ